MSIPCTVKPPNGKLQGDVLFYWLQFDTFWLIYSKLKMNWDRFKKTKNKQTKKKQLREDNLHLKDKKTHEKRNTSFTTL